MKQQDIDKKIGMPDVNAEWARFERETIDQKTESQKPLYWGIGIVASIALVAGIFLFGNGSKGENEGSVAMTEENKSVIPEEKDVNDGNAEKAISSYIIDNKSENLLAEVSDSETQDSLQRRIAGLDIVPNSSHLGANTMRLSGTSGQNGRDKDSVLVMVDGEAMLMAKNQITTEDNLEHFLKKDIESIMVYKDEDNKRPYVEKYGELAKNGVVDIKTKQRPYSKLHADATLLTPDSNLQNRIARLTIVPTPSDLDLGSDAIMRLGGDSTSMKKASLQGIIGGIGDGTPIRFVSKKERKPLPYLWERDTVLAVVNGKEDADFIQYLSEMPYWSMAGVYNYFYEKNQLFIKQSHHTDDLQSVLCDSSVLTGRDIRLVVNYQTKPFTPISQLHTNEIMLRRLAYLKNSYLAGFKPNSHQEYFSPDIYDTPTKERIFGLTAAKCHSSYYGRNEYFGPIGSDKNGTYVPLIRDAVLTTHDDAWYENGEICFLKDDTYFNQIIDDIRQAATSAESSIIKGDSIVMLAFINGGKVSEGQSNELIGRYMQKRLYEKAKANTFKFSPDADALSYWWAEVYYSTTSITSQRQLWMHLHSADKLYTADCPEILTNSRKIKGIVLNEKDEPLTGATVFVGSIPTTETIQGRTDSTGHFELCLPYPNASIQVSHIDYGTVRLSHPADTALTIRMKDTTSLKEVKVLPRVIKDMKALTDPE